MIPQPYNIICIVFFVLGILFHANAQKTPSAKCIEQVISVDDSLGTIRNHACKKISLSETIRNYVAEMRAINYDDCPEAFSTAFAAHAQAWENMLPLTDQFPGLRGELHVLFKQLENGAQAEEFKKLLKAIWDTWSEVEAAQK